MKKNNKPFYLFWFFLFWIALYIGYLLGGLMELGFINLNENIEYILAHPFQNYYNSYTQKTVIVMALVFFIAFLSELAKRRNYMVGREFGTAQWADVKQLNRKLSDKRNKKNNKILTENVKVSLNTRKTGLNNNLLIIGGSGAGKTRYSVIPNILECITSFIITDPKGEILKDTGKYLKEHGYVIKVVNLVEMEKSNCYNPFLYIRNDTDVVKLITNLIANTTPKGTVQSDPFWEKAESLYLQSLFYYVWMEYPIPKRNFNSLLELLNKAEVNDEEESELDMIMDRLAREKGDNHPAVMQYRKCVRGAGDTVRSIIISANSRLAFFENKGIKRILAQDEMDIASLGIGKSGNKKTKTALFCVIPDNDKSYNFIVGMLYTQIFQELYYQADFNYSGRLPIPVSFWLDEFANVALPDDFCSLLSTMRSREIYCNIIIQNLAQIKALFEKTWETITGNCDTLLYLGGNEQSTHDYISKMLGKWTIDKKTTGETLGRNGSGSRNYDVLGRELLMPDEVRKVENKKAICFIKGQDPIFDFKYPTFEDTKYKHAIGLGEYSHDVKVTKDDKGNIITELKKPDFEILSKESIEHYKNDKEGATVHTFNLEDFLRIDFNDDNAEDEEPINWEEVKRVFEENLPENEKENTNVEESEYVEGISNDDLEKLSLFDIIKKYQFNEEQYNQISLGLSQGMSEEEVKQYLNINYSAGQMAVIRELIQNSKESS